MKKLIIPTLFAICGASQAQVPSAPLMPDGSRDMYVGAGVAAGAKYAGADERRTRAALLLQAQWSNGVFVSGTSLGLHLSRVPDLEFGPLLAIEPGRGDTSLLPVPIGVPPGGASLIGGSAPRRADPVAVPDVPNRPVVGGFLNAGLAAGLRATGSLVYGAGNDRKGMLVNVALQKSILDAVPHHSVVLTAGATWANRDYQQDFFGVDPALVPRPEDAYVPSSGLRDVYAGVNWNWEWSPSWMLVTQLRGTRLMGPAADSPIAVRRNDVSLRTGIAYRF